MIRFYLLLLGGIVMLQASCAPPPPPAPPASPAFAALDLHSIAIGPVAFAVPQPDVQCSAFIDEDLRSEMLRELRRRGYDAFAIGNSVPRSFTAGPPPPLPGDIPAEAQHLPGGTDALLLVWLEEYWQNGLCERDTPKYLTMGAVGVLYAGSPPVEVWRSRSRDAEQGVYSSQTLMWLVTSRVSEGVLRELPAAALGERKAQR